MTFGPPPAGSRTPLATWIWRSYAKTALVPLLLVEVILIAIYIQSNYWSRQANIELLREEATGAMGRIVAAESELVSRQLKSVTQLTGLFRLQTALALSTPAPPGQDNSARYRFHHDGVYGTFRKDGGSSLYYSGVVPVGPSEQDKVRRTAALDPLMQEIKAINPLVVQLYFNSHDSLNRIYPYVDVSQYPPRMDITRFNFYYEADAAHDPDRVPVWTDVYLDPAGRGWLASCIAPVYRGNFLEGVVGLDVTVGTITRRVLDLQLPWGAYGVLVGKNGSLIALPEAGEADFGLDELLSHKYRQAVGQDTFKPDAFNLFKRPGLDRLAARMAAEPRGLAEADIGGERLVAWQRVEETGWTFLLVAAPARIFAPAMALSQRLERIAYTMIGALVLFYVLFFIALFIRARTASRIIAEPLKTIEHMMLGIGQGHYEQPAPAFNVLELHETARELSAMGSSLGAAHRDLMSAQQQVLEHVHWLDAVFQLSPDGLVTVDRNGRIDQANPAFLAMTGFTKSRVQGWTVAELWREIAALTPAPGAAPPFPGHGENGCTLELARPRPQSIHCQVRAFQELDTDAGPSGALIVYFRDLTREAELDRLKSEFLATAAHELRTPLTMVLGYAELLATHDLDPAAGRELSASILENGHNLQAIVADLLDIARLESRIGRDFTILPQPLAPVVREAIQAAAAVHPKEIRFEPDGLDAAEAPMDAEKFRKALAQILKNAAVYSPPASAIEVRLRRRAAAAGPELGVEVADHGIGMSPEQIARVFERFYRADTTGSIAGTGLGMSIVKEIMDVHGGSVDIASQPGEGTRVCLWLRA